MRLVLWLGIALGFMPVVSHAQTLALPLDEIKSQKKFAEPTGITDPRMKAENGSLNRYSAKLNLTYRGPVLNDFGVRDQPNPDGSVGNFATAISAKVAARYRLTSLSTLNAGTGIKLLRPTEGGDGTEVNNPYVAYAKATAFHGWQLLSTPTLVAVTYPSFLRVAQYGIIQWDNSATYDIPGSRFGISLDAGAALNLFSRGYIKKDKNSTSYSYSGGPSLNYHFTDRWSAHTSILYNWWSLRSQRQWYLQTATPFQRLGTGYAFRKDIYVAPYLEFYPGRIGFSTTTINVTTVISL